MLTKGSGNLGKCCGEEAGARNIAFCVFPRKVVAAGDEGQLVWEVGMIAVILTCDWFLHCVLHLGDDKML